MPSTKKKIVEIPLHEVPIFMDEGLAEFNTIDLIIPIIWLRVISVIMKQVDSHIQQLDQYLKKYDEDLRRDRESVATTGSSVQNVDSNNKPTKGSESGRGGRKKTRLGATTAATSAAAANPTSMDLDLPVDPNEPTYCFCNQVSYGEMVACDNPDVCIHSSIYLIFSFFLAVFRSRISREICGGKEYNKYMG
ncbi:hypothetical protein RHSIM_Rhsim02G0050200 [Rhododendron simsii]|uniref:Uncharacterized protein n=1 Tax=Rhododendron simsii TaxID=118357 RepID=A0A834HBX0_RHOSS|nr:hypothetical protein RHSIM_Rhsim02G0050200 [Rhododendron simsii]